MCSFKYARDTYSSANFKYDTTCKIEKEETKLFYKSKLVDIDKIKENKLLYINLEDVLNKEDKRYLYKENSIINKKKDISLEDTHIIKFNKNKYITLKKTEDINVNIEIDMKFEDTKGININIETDKNLLEIRYIKLNKSSKSVYLSIDRENLQLYKFESIYTDKIAEKEISKDQFIQNLELRKSINIEKHRSNYLNRIYSKEIDIDKLRFIEKYGVKNIDKDRYSFIDRVNLNEIDTINNKSMVNRDVITDITRNMDTSNLSRVNIKEVGKIYRTILMYKILLKDMDKYKYKDSLNRILIKNIRKDMQRKYLYREELKAMDKKYEKYLDRDALTYIFNNHEKYLNYLPLVNIYKQMDKDLLNISIWDIYKEHDKYLNGSLVKNIYKSNKNKFIEVTKRWWWLRPTAPTDKLIIPSKDYERMKELLLNPSYEYLRFNNHPIEWGTGWGIDYNIPSIAVSIEIMVDLVNILIMIWHKNTQAWLNCSGKEAIQFIMELFYDWYTMATSKPNADYYRVYKWIRWEAEKVYFLDTENGLQAIGILIANLIDYLKQHNFDLVPIWKNVKAMDIERNFNRVPKNGDLMKDLDKIKGNRHYMIETQNFEKKNILGR
ncbi:hypothetical protein [Clostridium argentinense]|uniref:hypothetical protein n=1 Tax=Clostridium argentinense TaxID=29341 RepID=UPI001F384084|nr:hypothetical protein [Clostridium argentinense]